jgi:pyruvate carboxylase
MGLEPLPGRHVGPGSIFRRGPFQETAERKFFMNEISFVDQTIRDAQQSLWGFTMRTSHMIPIAGQMDRVGYRAIATVGSQAFTVQVRILDEDPWDRIRQLSRLITKTPLRGSYQIGSLSSFDLSTPRDIIGLWIKRSVANGIRSFWICDYQTDMEKFVYFARLAKAEGAEVVPALMYTSSPAHTPEHWAGKTKLLAEAKEWVDRIMIEDASGVITPEDTKKLVSTVFKHCDGIPIDQGRRGHVAHRGRPVGERYFPAMRRDGREKRASSGFSHVYRRGRPGRRVRPFQEGGPAGGVAHGDAPRI